MKNKYSKELLSVVLGEEVEYVSPEILIDTGCITIDGLDYYLSVDTLEQKCKEWCLSKGCQFMIYVDNDGEIYQTNCKEDLYSGSSFSDVAQWVLDNDHN